MAGKEEEEEGKEKTEREICIEMTQLKGIQGIERDLT